MATVHQKIAKLKYKIGDLSTVTKILISSAQVDPSCVIPKIVGSSSWSYFRPPEYFPVCRTHRFNFSSPFFKTDVSHQI